MASCPRVAVVTGSNKGIGLAIVRALCKKMEGGIVYLTARDLGRGMEAVKNLEKEGLKPRFHLLDITDQESVDTLRNYLVENYGGVDVFIHNAAIAYKNADPTPFGKQAIDTIATNFTSTLHLCRMILPIMKENGRFVNLSSFVTQMALEKCSPEVQAFFKSADLKEEDLIAKMEEFVSAAKDGEHTKQGFVDSAYGMSKLGVSALTRILGRMAPGICKQGVLINCVCPGWVKTDMAGSKAPKTPDEGAVTPVFAALIPAGATEPNGEFLKDNEIRKWYN